jgi:casein kinase II subunit beta
MDNEDVVDVMEEYKSEEESEDSSTYWIDWFLGLKGNEFYCEIDEEFIYDRFNLAGLNIEVPHYQQAYELITDSLDTDKYDGELETHIWDEIEASARHLYGLIHARYIITGRGLTKMAEKYRIAEFGRCPRVLCQNQMVLPVGLSDNPGLKGVKLYCPHCEDVYTPPSRRHASIDGSYFGTSFPHLILQAFTDLIPEKRFDQYVPRIFGFKLHSAVNESKEQEVVKKQDLEIKTITS